jgi:hypothetical protein
LEGSERPIAASTLFPHEKAVVAAILAANGKKKEAEMVTRMVQPNQLSIQEIQLVQNEFRKLDSNKNPAVSSVRSESKPSTKKTK